MRTWMTMMMVAGAMTGCAADGALGASEAANEEDLIVRPWAPVDAATQLTLFSEAGYWGTSTSVSLGGTSSSTEQLERLVTTTDVRNAGLENRISSLRLVCGGRNAHVVLFWDYNFSTALSGWSEFAHGTVVECQAGQTVEVNLHTSAPELADRVASIYVLRHTRAEHELGLSWLVEGSWNQGFEGIDGATQDGDPRFRVRSQTTFDIHQWLRVDSFWCEERGAQFTVRATMDASGHWTAYRVDSYVDTGTGDAWGCRTEMQAAVQSGANDAAQRLADGLNELMALPGSHPRYYLFPGYELGEVNLGYGGEAALPPWAVPVDVYDRRAI